MIVLGYDAAWTPHHDSGIGIVIEDAGKWRCVAASSSVRELEKRTGCTGLLTSVAAAAGAPPTIVSVDMPLASAPITARRKCDTEISRAFGACGCSVHSPTPERPGPVSTNLMCDLLTAGFSLAVHGASPQHRQVIEVYPHIAVMRLLGEQYRFRYKVGRARQYWPAATASERRARLRMNLGRILEALNERIHGIPLCLPPDSSGPAALKRFEDALDGLVCAWIGARYLEGGCASYGDDTAAIWIPLN
jgi:predicted RNase H-like nuclease